MMIRTASRIWLAWALVLIVHMPSAAILAFELEIEGGRISVQANQAPLQQLLKAVSRHGIAVRMDPGINPSVTLSFRDRDLEDGLKAILRPHNHVFVWRADPDSSPAEHQLSEIHVFRPGRRERMVVLDTPVPKARSDSREGSAIEADQAFEDTKVLIRNNKVFVPVVLGYQDREVETTLIFDTGAGSIVLHQNVADELGIVDTQASHGQGVGGIAIQTRAARLDYVRVGPHKKENLRTDVIEYQGTPDENYNGLLGMNFIRGLKYIIDFDQQVIQWRR